ncbi:hypothetical protein PHMEG_00019554 [Phytophthora megakarya]|uniref:ZSWIM1/3 RNaseH-like domain-containing protein n=1 Tax=Phytophthora megakarya TaxID=4795 RepID=A0A225VRB6_9STRA|nr:hypothetical protein PHMEG_00019554 [Phytophthora megakarya]
MRCWVKAFPEVLLIDATHNTHESRYKLFSIMVNDVYGHAFKPSNSSWQDVRVSVIVKDRGELRLLEKEFDDFKLILCHFHVKTISEQRWKRTNTVANRALTGNKSRMPSI